jgi:hypothetical protein
MWQRSYSWGPEEISEFWNDLRAFDVKYPGNNLVGEEYFLGSIVLVTDGEKNLLLDGQQRLATATILLSALREARLDYNSDAATRLQTKYISDFDDATGSQSFVLTLNTFDQQFFCSEVQEMYARDAPPKPSYESHQLIRKAREFFERKISEEKEILGHGEAAFKWNLRISRVLCDHMSVVAVSSSDEDNAAEVFETLNDRGIGLSAPDLLRNLILRRASDANARERVTGYWHTILDIHDDTSVESFIRHYWVSNYGDVKTRKLYRAIKDDLIGNNVESVSFSRDLSEAASVYRDIVAGNDDDPGTARYLQALRTLGAKVAYPLLLSGYAVASSVPDGNLQLYKLARALTIMYVRYSVIGGHDGSVMESEVYAAAANLRREKDFNAAIDVLIELSPGLDEFSARFQVAKVSRIATARYLLREIEHAKRRTQELTVSTPDRVHVEHIYPQNPEASNRWPNHANFVTRLGNLTLLGKSLNTSVKNSTFDIKRKRAYEESDILMTRELCELDKWDESAVDRRQAELSNWIPKIWKFPGEACQGVGISVTPETSPLPKSPV